MTRSHFLPTRAVLLPSGSGETGLVDRLPLISTAPALINRSASDRELASLTETST